MGSLVLTAPAGVADGAQVYGLDGQMYTVSGGKLVIPQSNYDAEIVSALIGQGYNWASGATGATGAQGAVGLTAVTGATGGAGGAGAKGRSGGPTGGIGGTGGTGGTGWTGPTGPLAA